MNKITIKKTKTQQKFGLYSHRISDLVRNLMFELINNLKQNLISLENAEIPFEALFIIENDNELEDSIRNETTKNSIVILKLMDKEVLLNFKSYWYNDQYLYNEMTISSQEEFNFTDYEFFEYLLNNAIYHSEFKGAYINIEGDDIQNFHTHELPERSFEDIFLPEKLLQPLNSYISIYEKRKRLIRYLFVGMPGSGKTESLIVIANALKQQGVTILKVAAAGIRNAVKLANILAPSLIILDDMDLELGNREDHSESEHLKAFLDMLDGVEKLHSDVGIIATTNSLWLVDTAAQRPGRFNKIMGFGELTDANAKNIILKALKSVDMNHLSILSDEKIIQHYMSQKSSGAYIYNMTQMLANQLDIGVVEESVKDILAYIQDDSETLSYFSEKTNI
ncbi:MAG: ATP-binding protein [Cytophagales bacterium]|nr:MAG: ATP-binding protein [Cytophagales bacterium]